MDRIYNAQEKKKKEVEENEKTEREIDKKYYINSMNIRVLGIVCMIIIYKMFTDKPHRNPFYAKLFGFEVSLINEAEEYVLRLLNYEIHIHEEEYAKYRNALPILK
jgi:hypothetical protein